MKFGPRPTMKCEGCLLAHSLKSENLVFRKGHILTANDITAIKNAGIAELTVARLEDGDLSEDIAAQRLASAMKTAGIISSHVGTGRVNFHADCNGQFTVSRDLVDAINKLDPGITLATLNDLEPVLEGRMLATVKIIPYAVPETALKSAEELVGSSEAFQVRPYRAQRIGMISTKLPGLKEGTIRKTERVLQDRLSASGSKIVGHSKVAHCVDAVCHAMKALENSCDLLILFGASAISDVEDVLPMALKAAGGLVKRVGMPVDPGNLLMLGELGGKPVIGAPGCSRSPARNGFDFVLERLLADIEVTASDIAGLGVGGLLMEIGSRPQPREADQSDEMFVEALVLAAGQSRRMGKVNKLLLDIKGIPMVRHVVEAARSMADKTTVVTGHQSVEIEAALQNLTVNFVHNPDYAQGLSTSLKAGILATSPQATHVMVLLGDMPRIDRVSLTKMIEKLKSAAGGSIIVANNGGKRGNPVIWPRAYFEALSQISGDTGARHLIGENQERVVEVELGTAASLDVDTPEAYRDLTPG